MATITKPVTAKDATISVGNGASPEVFTSIGYIVKDTIKFSGEARKPVEVTRYNSAGGVIEYLAGPLIEPGSLDFKLYLAPDDVGQAALITQLANGTVANYKVIFDAGPNYTFPAAVESIVPELPTSKAAEFTAKLKLTAVKVYASV
jgi:predicted secreted protein